MGQPAVKEVVEYLNAAHLRTQRGFPGERAPDIQVPALTVNIHKKDAHSVCMEITVFSPVRNGAVLCEDTALRACEVLQDHGASCTQEKIAHDGRGDRFFIRILALWKDDPPQSPYAVSINGSHCAGVTGFSSRQESEKREFFTMGQTEPIQTVSRNPVWTLTLEQTIPGGTLPPREFPDPFSLAVVHNRTAELYSGCRWKTILREDRDDGLHITSVAESRERSVKQND